ncbi:MAG: hypothetical protein ACHBN1_02075 [Heteroscytonema crispum UTEX LB 1556]
MVRQRAERGLHATCGTWPDPSLAAVADYERKSVHSEGVGGWLVVSG